MTEAQERTVAFARTKGWAVSCEVQRTGSVLMRSPGYRRFLDVDTRGYAVLRTWPDPFDGPGYAEPATWLQPPADWKPEVADD